MNKKMLRLALAGAICFCASTAVVPASAADMKAPTTVTREPGKSMVLTMRDVASIFTEKYADTAIHSIALKPEKGQFAYQVVGYSMKKTYTANIDIITGKILKESEGGKERDLMQKIFNPNQVIDQQQAQAVAVTAIGEGAVSKAWELSADRGLVTYVVTVHQGMERTDVTINAKDGSVMAIGEPSEVKIED